jgi:hypothetical protein
MTLKEKFKKTNETSWLRNESLLELIADKYAIEFAKWYINEEEFDNKAEYYLKMFKEQKGL